LFFPFLLYFYAAKVATRILAKSKIIGAMYKDFIKID